MGLRAPVGREVALGVHRFRLRTLMIAVAILGGLLAIGIEVRRLSRVATGHRQKAMLYALQESRWLAALQRQDAMIRSVEAQYQAASPDDPARKLLLQKAAAELRQEHEDLKPRLEQATTLKIKYERAARRPWETMAPNPGESR